MVEINYIRDKRPYGTRIASVERRANYLQGKIDKGADTSYDRSELEGLKHAISAMQRYKAEHRTGHDAVELLKTLRIQCARGLYQNTLSEVDEFLTALEI